MDKSKILDHLAADSESRLSLARLLDQLELCRRRDIPTHSHFLSDGEQVLAVQAIAAYGGARYALFGGYPNAARQVCVFLPDWAAPAGGGDTFDPHLTGGEDTFDPRLTGGGDTFDPRLTGGAPVLAAVAVTLPKDSKLTHRDFLGSLMGLGITRDLIGDILVGGESCQVVCLASALPILLNQWNEVGRHSVSPREVPLASLAAVDSNVERFHETFQSLRFDAVAASAFRIPRSKAASLIAGGRLLLNHLPCAKPDRLLQEGDSLTGKGLGKCRLTKVNGLSRKGRIIVEMERYI